MDEFTLGEKTEWIFSQFCEFNPFKFPCQENFDERLSISPII